MAIIFEQVSDKIKLVFIKIDTAMTLKDRLNGKSDLEETDQESTAITKQQVTEYEVTGQWEWLNKKWKKNVDDSMSDRRAIEKKETRMPKMYYVDDWENNKIGKTGS